MNLKRWTAAIMAALALVACGTPAVQTVARLNNIILTRHELDQRIARIEKGAQAQQGQQPPPRLDIEHSIVDQFINQNLILDLARQKGITIADNEIDGLIEQFRTTIPQQTGGTLDAAVQGQLGLPSGDSSEFRQFASFVLAQQKLGNSLVTTDTVRAEMNNQLQAEMDKKVEQVHSAHILVDTEEEAKQVLERLDKGEKFEDLAKELSKDTGSGANGGDLGFAGRGNFVPEFEAAIFDQLKPGEVTKTPVKSQFGYHIIKVIEREERPAMTPEQAEQMIEQSIGQQIQSRRQEELQKLIESEHAKAKSEGRLVEPTYPTPVPAPPAQPDGQPAPPEGQPAQATPQQ